MEIDICRFCLSQDRVLKPLGSYSSIYKRLTGGFVKLEWKMDIDDIPICWECRAQLKRITGFNHMIINANNILRKKYFTLSNLKPNYTLSKLKLTKTRLLTPDCCLSERVKEEVNHTVELKIEPSESTFNDVYGSDDVKSEVDIDDVPLAVHAKARKQNIQIKNKRVKRQKEPGPLFVQRFDRYIMSEQEMLKTRKELQNNKWYYKKEFKCEGCIKGFHNQSLYNAHIEKFHLMLPDHKTCDICSCVVAADKLAQHRLSHYVGYKCDVCDHRCHMFRDMWRHYTSLHDRSVVYPCRHCDKVLTSRASYRYHVRNVHGQKLECEYCGRISSNSTIYKNHLLQHTGMPMHECTVCHKSYRGSGGLARHMMVHDDTPQMDAYCAECDIQFKNIYTYRVHLKNSRRHLVDEPSFTCEHCGKKFFNKSLLTSHIRSHDPHKYQCKLCPKKYRKKFTLKQHISIVHDGKPQPRNKVCEICGRGFTTRAILESHIRTHTGDRPYTCPLCPANFGHKGAMYTHKRLVHKVPMLRKKNQ